MPKRTKGAQVRTTAFVEKFYVTTDHFVPPEQFRKNDTQLQSVVNDGGLAATECDKRDLTREWHYNVTYSLNKRKRWMLPSLLHTAISDDLEDAEFPVSCLVRKAQPDRYANYDGIHVRALPAAMSFALHQATVAGTMANHPPTKPIFSFAKQSKKLTTINGLIAGSTPFKENMKSENDDLNSKSRKARQKATAAAINAVDFGIFYHVGVVPHGQTTNREIKCKPSYNGNISSHRMRTQIHNSNRRWNADVCMDSLYYGPDLNEDTNSNDVDNGGYDSAASRNARGGCYDFDELMAVQQDRQSNPRRRRRRFTTESAQTYVLESDSPGMVLEDPVHPVVSDGENGEDKEEVRSATNCARVRAAEESQRTFLISDSMDNLCKKFLDTDDRFQVCFVDIGLSCAAVLLAKRTLFGLELSLKGHQDWLAALPEFTDLSTVCRFVRDRNQSRTENKAINCLESLLRFDGASVRCFDVLQNSLFLRIPQTPSVGLDSVCCICCEDFDVLRNDCGHAACRSCWKLHVVAKVADGVSTPTCVMANCGAQVSDFLIGLVAPWHTLEAWQNRNLDVIMSQGRGIYCPTPRCTGVILPNLMDGVMVDGDRNGRTLSRCNRCRRMFCSSCGQTWHWPSPCKDADTYHQLLALRNDDPWIALHYKKLKYLSQTKSCPACRLPMEKGYGCNNMTCNCGASFCWNCARLISDHYKGDEYLECRTTALDVIDVGDGSRVSCREEAYKMAVDFRANRYNLRRMSELDRDMHWTLTLLYHVMEYTAVYQSRLPMTGRTRFTAKRLLLDLAFLCDRMIAHHDDSSRTFYVDLAKSAVTQLQREFCANFDRFRS